MFRSTGFVLVAAVAAKIPEMPAARKPAPPIVVNCNRAAGTTRRSPWRLRFRPKEHRAAIG